MTALGSQTAAALLAAKAPDETASLMQDLIRIPSHRWEENEAASYVAGFLRALGLEVVVQPVEEGEVRSKQVIGRLRGSATGHSVMLCGHLDTSTSPPDRSPYRPELWTHGPYSGDIVDGWIYGLGAVNMKGGVAAMLDAVRALVRAGLTPKGDVIVAAVMGETAGGLGVEYMLNAGIRADMAIVTECTDMDVVTVAVSACRGYVHVEGETAHHLPHKSAIQVAADLITAMGPTFAPIPPDGWLPHTPHPDLPGYPRFAFREAQSYDRDFCRLSYDCRIIPGITPDDVQRHLQKPVEELGIKGRVEQPPHPHIRNRPTAFGVEEDHPVVQVLSGHSESVLGRPVRVGAGKRLGGAADASNLLEAGIPTVTFGPGVIDVWPMVDERCELSDVVAASQILALTIAELSLAD